MATIVHVIAILFEAAGTLWLLYVLKSSSDLAKLSFANVTMDNIETILNGLRDAASAQFKQQLPGFGLLLVGLIIQIIFMCLH